MLPQDQPKIDRAAIKADLLFMTQGWDTLGIPVKFEVRAFGEGKKPQWGHFKLDWIEDAVDWIDKFNALGFNCYAVRNPIHDKTTGSAKDTDVAAAYYMWADCDDAESGNNVKRFDGPKHTTAVVTGTIPHARVHVYWRLNEPCLNLNAWRNLQVNIADHFGSDGAVINPSRVMRIAGTITYPDERKKSKGYVSETSIIRTQYDDDREPVDFDQMLRVFHGSKRATTGAESAAGGHFDVDTGEMGRTEDHFADILRRAKTDGEKHTGVRDLAAHLAGTGVSIEMAYAFVRQSCPVWDDGVEKLIKTAYQKFWSKPDLPAPISERFQDGLKADEEDDGEWIEGLLTNSKGRPLFNTANVMHVFRSHNHWKHCFAFDEFKQVKMLTARIPGSPGRGIDGGRELKDADAINAVAWFNLNGFPNATKNIVFDAIESVINDATYHPVRNYLDDLPEWDGQERAGHWLANVCGAFGKDDQETKYIYEVGKRWLISCVARAMKPGCKADGVLILEGTQGAGKSTVLRLLAGEDWFGDALPNMASKDASDYIRGKWIIELAELSNINKSEVEVVKAFISRSEERFRPAYGRTEITYPRQCVFAGSTNKSDYLRDETGNRRFWPVRCGDACNFEYLKQNRDQIWAEALAMFRAGEHWWLPEDVIVTAKEQQEKRVTEDAWSAPVLEFSIAQGRVSCGQIGKEVLNLELGRQDRLATNRISAILSNAGFVRDGQITSGQFKGQAAYRKIEGDV